MTRRSTPVSDRRGPPISNELVRDLLERIQQFIASNLEDLRVLRTWKAGLTPSDAEQWNSCLDRIARAILRTPHIADEWRSALVVENLNRQWLARRGFCALLGPADRQMDEEDCDWNELTLYRLRDVRFCEEMKPSIARYLVDECLNRDTKLHAAFLQHQQCIVINVRRTHDFAATLWSMIHGWKGLETTAEEQMRRERHAESAMLELKLLSSSLVPEYRTFDEFHGHYFQRVELEEVRHALDHLRHAPRLEKPVDRIEFCQQYVTRTLRADGFVAAVLGRKVADANWNDPDTVNAAEAFTHAISEISAQLTAGALCMNPRIVMREWWARLWALSEYGMQDVLGHASLPHSLAARLIIRLLAMADGISLPAFERDPGTSIALAHLRECHNELTNAAAQLAQRPHDHLRLLMKQVYAQEFSPGIIDEPPFGQEIGPDGKLTPRLMFQALVGCGT
jgi:hypothetical protein